MNCRCFLLQQWNLRLIYTNNGQNSVERILFLSFVDTVVNTWNSRAIIIGEIFGSLTMHCKMQYIFNAAGVIVYIACHRELKIENTVGI